MSKFQQIRSLLDLSETSGVSVTLFYGWLINNFELYAEVFDIINNYNLDDENNIEVINKFNILSKEWREYLFNLSKVDRADKGNELILGKFGSSNTTGLYLAWNATIFTLPMKQSVITLPNLEIVVQNIRARIDEWIKKWSPPNIYLGDLGWHLITWKDF